ncbi:olfactory receptor family 9 subfamily S member 43 [Bos taurus]|uniref:Olfactory receptor n=1 Tax=Bos taurus TaxID=9913 RepID=A0ABI0NP64_BOVIN|nr:olfactory receptor family 9 subfamily S member 43 [Bos taurus]DAA30879.1 TPA: olfactory receptor Olr1346-like [Bos taurus]
MSPYGNGNLSVMPLQEFVLDGFGGGPQIQALLFALFLVLYLVDVLGNLTMIVVIMLDARLHSPMYFFLKNLSFLDLCYSSVIYPKALFDLMSSTKVITFAGCVTQFFFFSTMITTEGFLLAVMAYDRFMAICNPLLYPISMRPSVCALLMLGCYCGGSFNSILQASFTFSLPFCSSNHIDHFHCDVPPLLKLACADTTTNELVMFGLCGLVIVGTILVVLVSYGYITVTILRIRSGGGRHKLFSTCGSHMTAVSLLYGTAFIMYAQPGALQSMDQGKVVSVFYTLVIPMLNPLIYSLRNKDVKDALWRLSQKHTAT